MKDIKQVFSANVRSYRLKSNLTQQELADSSGLHVTYIGGVERGERSISLDNIQKIADALEIEAYKLFKGEIIMGRTKITERNFGEAERYINDLFEVNSTFVYENETYEVLFSGKPTCAKGEPKTDIYIYCRRISDNTSHELKISVKKSNADFLENKTSANRAELIFGPSWMDIIKSSTLQLENEFTKKPLIYKNKKGRTEKGCITLGWKFELMNKKSGALSGEILLNKQQLMDVYAGSNLPDDKKHAFVDNRQIRNSGIANSILIGELDTFKTAQEVIDNLISIEEYTNKHPKVYYACKALNYRTFKKKFDGNRPLSVFIDWDVVNNKLSPTVCFDKPLVTRGNEVAIKLKESLEKLDIKTTDDIKSDNVTSLDFVY